MTSRKLHDGRAEGLESLDLGRVHNFRGLLTDMGQTAFAGWQLGEAFDILLATIQDPDCRLVLTVSGP